MTGSKLVNRNNEQKIEGIWLGKTTNGGDHIVATKDNPIKPFYTRSLTRLPPELQWDKKIWDNIVFPQLDLTMNENYLEEEHIGKAIMQEFFTKTRLTEKQPGHRLW
eukprot:5453888-Amphidinium_carterae.1